jgi:hypothetical protein
METMHPAAQWAQQTNLAQSDIDCVTTVALKILDGKCKMGQEEKDSLMAIYDVVRFRPGELFDDYVHMSIEFARTTSGLDIRQAIHELRLEAEAAIPKPVMKSFKAMLRSALSDLQPAAVTA